MKGEIGPDRGSHINVAELGKSHLGACCWPGAGYDAVANLRCILANILEEHDDK